MNRKLIFLLICLLAFGSADAAPGSPPGSLLEGPLIAADTAAQDEIVIYDVGTGTRRELTFGTGWQRVWGFSPDGCRLLYTSSAGSQPASLYSARIDGSDARLLVAAGDGSGVWEPQWGADRIAYTWIDAGGNADIGGDHRIAWIKPETGETGFYSVSGDEHSARWSPDGQRLVYTAYEQRVAGADTFSTAEPTRPGTVSTMQREADLWVVNADGTNKFRLTNFPVGSVTMPRWSPDGDLIGFVYSPSPNNDTFWMIGSTPDAVPTQLSYEWVLALDLTWLPDSTALIASARDLQGIGENRLWHLPLTGNADQNAVQYVSDPALSYLDYPRFSADGKWLAVRSEYALALVNTPDMSWRWLDQITLGNTPPVWSSGGVRGRGKLRVDATSPLNPLSIA